MYKEITGICPKYGKECSIVAEYIDASTFTESVFVKGLARCELALRGCDMAQNCDLLQRFPENIEM